MHSIVSIKHIRCYNIVINSGGTHYAIIKRIFFHNRLYILSSGRAESYKITDYIKKNNGACKVFPSPFAVFLNADDKTYVEPDISVICDKSKLDDRGCVGAPDWIIEIASPSTKRTDYGVKLFKYRSAGVREYWIVNPLTRTVNVYDLEKEELNDQYSFDDDIAVCIYDNLTINITELLKQ